jgi:pimeloyl-ACP methyl ester carboxylesterase
MTKTTLYHTPNGALAVHQSDGDGPPIVLIHGNSSSSRAFSRQLEGPLGRRRRLIAIDLLGHGRSENATDLAAYLLPGHALAVAAVAGNFGLDQALFVGWSLGGHILLEAAKDLPKAAGFLIFGAPPVPLPPPPAPPPTMERAFLPNPTMSVGFTSDITRAQAEAYVASFFAPGFADVPPFFLEDALRTDGRARAQVAASMAPGVSRDEAQVVGALKQPLAVLHGAREQFVNSAYYATVRMPTLWRGAVQTIASAGHAPQWETPVEFDALVEAFADDCG